LVEIDEAAAPFLFNILYHISLVVGSGGKEKVIGEERARM